MADEINMSLIAFFCAFVCLICLSSSTLTEQFPPNDTLQLNITAFIGHNKRLLEVVNEPVTWFEAFYKCEERGFVKLINSFPGSIRMVSMTQALRESGTYSTNNASFWVGFFRPYLILERWYRTGDTTSLNPDCNEFTTSQAIDDVTGSSDQCAFINYTDFMAKPILVSANCSTRLPYLCDESISVVEYFVYNGFDVVTMPALFTVSSENDTNLESCKSNCTNKYKCAGFSFYNDSNYCMLFKLDDYYYTITYSISRVAHNVTHAVKDSSRFNFTSNSVNMSRPEDDLVFPACIPTGYCLNGTGNYSNTPNTPQAPINDTQLEQAIAEIVQSLTIDVDSTAKSKQRYESASDDRGNAKAFGALAIIMITVVCAIPVMFDLINILEYLDKKKLKEKKRMFRKTSEINEESV